MKRSRRRIDKHVQVAREQAIARYFYWKRG
jgi:hypothetical protein